MVVGSRVMGTGVELSGQMSVKKVRQFELRSQA
jgi:hypothetical protein